MRVRSRRWTALCPPARFAVVAQSRGGHASPCLPHRPRRARRGVRRVYCPRAVRADVRPSSKTKAGRPRDSFQASAQARRRRGPPVTTGTRPRGAPDPPAPPAPPPPAPAGPVRRRSLDVTRVRPGPGALFNKSSYIPGQNESARVGAGRRLLLAAAPPLRPRCGSRGPLSPRASVDGPVSGSGWKRTALFHCLWVCGLGLFPRRP